MRKKYKKVLMLLMAAILLGQSFLGNQNSVVWASGDENLESVNEIDS